MNDLFGHVTPTTLEEGREAALEQLHREWRRKRFHFTRTRAEKAQQDMIAARKAYMGLLRYHHRPRGTT